MGQLKTRVIFMRREEEKVLKRKAFLDQKDVISYQMTIEDLRKAVAYYREKHKIKIFINGDEIETLRTQALRQPKTKYATFLEKNYNSAVYLGYRKELKISYDSMPDLFSALQEPLKDFINPYGNFRDDLLLGEKEELYFRLEKNEALIKQLDVLIEKEIVFLSKKENICSEDKLLFDEIKAICAQLNPTESVGYIYTTGRIDAKERAHFEFFILQQNAIIRPIAWDGIDRLEISYMTRSTRSDDVLTYYAPPVFKSLSAQADSVSCGTLGLLYLKKLLKNNAQALRENCLRFIYDYNGYNQRVGMFIPTADVLHYSQSRTYNQAFFQFVLKEFLPFEPDAPRCNFGYVITLQQYLKNSIQFFQGLNDLRKWNGIISQNQNLLENLPKWRETWCAAANQDMEKHGKMQLPKKGNRFLIFRAASLKEKAQEAAQSAHSVPG